MTLPDVSAVDSVAERRITVRVKVARANCRATEDWHSIEVRP